MTDASTVLELSSGPLRLALRPDLGGAIAGLWRNDLPVLRGGDARAIESSAQAGAFVMAPYCNRIGPGRFRWHGRDHALRLNAPGSPYPMHGLAWQRPWRVRGAESHRAELELEHRADADWPFDFHFSQRLVLSPTALELHLVLRNTGDRPAPAGMGWQPRFPKRARSRLHAEVAQRWETGPDQLPTRRVVHSGIDGDVAHLAFDHCFEGWTGAARLRDEKLSLRLTSSMPYLVVSTPSDADHYCVEPVSHVSNALHMAEPAAHGMRTLEAGQSLEAWVRLDVGAI